MDFLSPSQLSQTKLTSNPNSQQNNAIRQKAEELEGVFLNTLMSQMFSSLETDGMFGGGYGEETWRSMQSEQYANLFSQNGGVGLADQIMSNLLDVQENAKIQNNPTMPANAYSLAAQNTQPQNTQEAK
jgi:Rod binding domain-containing protein